MSHSEDSVFTTRAEENLNKLHPQYFQAILCLKSRIEKLEEIVSLNKEFPYEAQLLALDTITAAQQLQSIIKHCEFMQRITPEQQANHQRMREARRKEREAKGLPF